MAQHNEIGKQGEAIAAGFLETKGLHILDKNYRFDKSEIDIVALQLEPAEVVFVEVKTRSTEYAGYPENTIDETKKKHLFRAADAYLYEKQLLTVPARFDIIAISLQNPEHPMIYHIEDAFRY